MVARLAEEKDFEAYFALRCEQTNVYWTGHTAPPAKKKLYKWYFKNISKADRYFFLFFEEHTNSMIGYLYIDVDSNKIVDVSYGVSSFHTGKKYGTQINKFAIEFAKQNIAACRYLEAWIASDNFASIKCVVNNGYQETHETKQVNFASGEIKMFYKYVFRIA